MSKEEVGLALEPVSALEARPELEPLLAHVWPSVFERRKKRKNTGRGLRTISSALLTAGMDLRQAWQLMKEQMGDDPAVLVLERLGFGDRVEELTALSQELDNYASKRKPGAGEE